MASMTPLRQTRSTHPAEGPTDGRLRPAVRHVADRVAILYLGRIVELAPAEELFAEPNHPYTQALLAEVPRVDTGKRQFKPIEGEIPSPLNPPPGCHFHPRCPFAMARCKTEVPALREIAAGRLSACHLNG